MKQLYAAPAGETGLWIAGGWHGVTQHPDHGAVLELPAGDYSSIQRLGYTPIPTLPSGPTQENVASDGFPEVAADPQ